MKQTKVWRNKPPHGGQRVENGRVKKELADVKSKKNKIYYN